MEEVNATSSKAEQKQTAETTKTVTSAINSFQVPACATRGKDESAVRKTSANGKGCFRAYTRSLAVRRF